LGGFCGANIGTSRIGRFSGTKKCNITRESSHIFSFLRREPPAPTDGHGGEIWTMDSNNENEFDRPEEEPSTASR
jgi:hypothetical protein